MFERRGGEVLGQRLAEQLEEAYSSAECVDRKALSVIAGEQCWVLYVDALVCMYMCVWGGGRGDLVAKWFGSLAHLDPWVMGSSPTTCR